MAIFIDMMPMMAATVAMVVPMLMMWEPRAGFMMGDYDRNANDGGDGGDGGNAITMVGLISIQQLSKCRSNMLHMLSKCSSNTVPNLST